MAQVVEHLSGKCKALSWNPTVPPQHPAKMSQGTPMLIVAWLTEAKREATQVSNNRWMGKPDVVYAYNGILLSLLKEAYSYILQHG
jgi:hypothetical protein